MPRQRQQAHQFQSRKKPQQEGQHQQRERPLNQPQNHPNLLGLGHTRSLVVEDQNISEGGDSLSDNEIQVGNIRPGGNCMIFWCSKEALCKCPFCPAKFCEKHGTKSKYDAWPFEKFQNNIPYKYWPCDMCDRKLRENSDFIELCGGPSQYPIVLKAFLMNCTDEELNKGLRIPKKGNLLPEEVTFNCKICDDTITLSRIAKQTGKGSFHALATPIYGGIGVALMGPFGVFLGFILGGMASVNSFKEMAVCGNCCADCKSTKEDCSCANTTQPNSPTQINNIPWPSPDSVGAIGIDGKEWITFPPNSQNHFYRNAGDGEWIYSSNQ